MYRLYEFKFKTIHSIHEKPLINERLSICDCLIYKITKLLEIKRIQINKLVQVQSLALIESLYSMILEKVSSGLVG